MLLMIWGATLDLGLVNPILLSSAPTHIRLLFDILVLFLTAETLIHLVAASITSLRIGVADEDDDDADLLSPDQEGHEVHEAVNGFLTASPAPADRSNTTPPYYCGRLMQWLLDSPDTVGASAATLQAIHRLMALSDRMVPEQRRSRLLDAPRRHCRMCRRWKAPREHHCSVCRTCVPKMDHHCVFIGTCVDVTNQRYFTSLLVWLLLSCLFEFFFLLYAYIAYTFQVEQPLRRFAQQPSSRSLAVFMEGWTRFNGRGAALQSSQVLQVMFIALFGAVTLVYFVVTHVKALLTNTTAIEEEVLKEKRFLFNFSYQNPYNRSWLENIMETYGRPAAREARLSSSLTRRAAAWVTCSLLFPPPSSAEMIAEREERGALEEANPFPQGRPSAERRCLNGFRVVLWLLYMLVVPVLDDGDTYDGVHYPMVWTPDILSHSGVADALQE